MRLTVQLYTVRDALEANLEGTLAEIRQIGFEYVELAGMYGKSAAEWKTMLDGLGLKASGTHVGIDAMQGQTAQVIEDAQTLGIPYVILPWIGGDWLAKGWAHLGETAEALAQKFGTAGLKMAYHNHDFEFKKDDAGVYGLDTFFAAAPTVVAQLDLAWVAIGGADPAEYLAKYAGRVPLAHAKDYDPTQTPQWVACGDGLVGYAELLPKIEAAGVEYLGVELDQSPGVPMDSVRRSYEFLASQGLK